MDNFTTVFLFTNKANALFASNSDEQKLYFYGILFGLFILLVLIVARKEKGAKAGFFFVGVWLGILLLITLLSRQLNSIDKQRYEQLLQLYDNRQYEVAEGIVHVIEPASGREHGDFITIDGTEFEVGHHSLPYGGFGYMDTIAKDGVLKEGVYVRIYYINDAIIRIDVRDSN